jgi:hypothetical protein
MGVQKMMVDAVDPDGKWLYRVGGISTLVIGIGYLITIPLYASVGASPSGGEAKLIHLAENMPGWWAIFGLMVLTDFLFVPVGLSLYLALKGINRNAMLLATACVGLFIVLDVAVTWASYAALITLSGSYAAATNDAQKAVFVAAANYPATVLDSILTRICAILTLSLGILLTGFVMLKGIFNKITAYLGLLTGISGIIAVAGPLFTSALSVATYINAILATVWILLVGYRLYRLGQQ